MPRAPTHDTACPICDAPASPAFHPFCGQGCRDRDLIRWLSEGYRLPGEHDQDEDGEAHAPGLDRRGQSPL